MKQEQAQQSALETLEQAVRNKKEQEELEKLELRCVNLGIPLWQVIDAVHKGKGWKDMQKTMLEENSRTAKLYRDVTGEEL